MLERFGRTVVRFRAPILAGWIVLLAAGLLASSRLSPLLATSFAVPGTESERARLLLQRHFGERPDGTFTVVGRHVATAVFRARVERGAHVVPGARLGPVRTSGGVVFADLVTRLDLQHAKRRTAPLRAALAGSPSLLVTGQPAVQADLDPVFTGDLHRGEALAVPLTLLALVGLFGVSLAVLVPFAVAACTIATTLGAVFLVAHKMSMVAYARNLVELIGLALAVDYSLLVVHRFREELDRHARVEDAVARTVASAGRAVAFSGGAVAIGLGLLLLVPVPFIRSMGVAGLLVPLVSVAAALTLQPALLALLGRRLRGRGRTGAAWERLARRVIATPGPFLAAGALALVLLSLPALRLRVTPGSLTGIPGSSESVRGYELLRAAIGGGVVTPTHLVVARDPDGAATRRLANELAHDPEVLLVASGRHPPYVADGYRRIVVAGRHDWGAAESRRLVQRIRTKLVPAAHANAVAGGAPAQGLDFVRRTYGALPWLVAAVLAITFVVLLRAFRSLLLPLKAIVLNLLAVGAAYGVLELVFERPIEAWIPVFLFAALFGLSMDYEVFMVSRMREAHDAGEADADAVAHGLGRTGPVVTTAAAIMVAAFSGFAIGRIEGLREFGVGLAVAVALDATIVRAVLVPSVMSLLGAWNWWLPGRARGRAEARPRVPGPPT